jgi:tagatose-1,6-bisphosphate aldolase non-catalytic subunit AgaZ/GatZ
VARGLSEARDRVIGLVVQTGAEFGDAVVHDYEAENARMLAANPRRIVSYSNAVPQRRHTW